MLLILNFSTLTFITNARTTMPFARLHSQMVCTQSEPAEIPQHFFVQILVQVGGDRKWRTSRTTLRTPTPLAVYTLDTRQKNADSVNTTGMDLGKDVLCSAPPNECRDTQDHLEKKKKRSFSRGCTRKILQSKRLTASLL